MTEYKQPAILVTAYGTGGGAAQAFEMYPRISPGDTITLTIGEEAGAQTTKGKQK